MSFEIYFDESNKLDKFEGQYSYYGIIGWDETKRLEFEKYMNEKKIYGELHFTDFKLDKLDKYISAINYTLDKIEANFYIVNKNEAFKVSNKLGINESNLRNLFYIKIPERLIYGMTREIKQYIDITIHIDKSDEYGNDDERLYDERLINNISQKLTNLYLRGLDEVDMIENEENYYNNKSYKIVEKELSKALNHIQLPNTLKEQLNAQSLYRDLNYSVKKVKQIDSKSSKSLQITDVLLGIIRFLHEEEYFDLNKSLPEHIVNEYLIGSDKITDYEKDTFNSCYKYNKKIKTYEVCKELQLDELYTLRQISKKLNLYSQSSIQKSEFIYRLVQDDNILDKLFNLKIFTWESYNDFEKTSYIKNFKEVFRVSISSDIVKFLKFKNDYDNNNKIKLLKFKYEQDIKSQELTESDFKNELKFGSNLKLMVRRYLKELNIF